ncbi:MAG TPA: TIGR03435 family protein [Acidobacteriaceae bacterium]|nr:TIGR03435 family protein [Acidobacteriaceae bacterium]
MTFEAASVRPGRKFFLNGWDFLAPAHKAAPPKGGFFSWNAPLAALIYFAYDIREPHVQRSISTDMPKWAKEEWYAVEARADGDPTRDDVRQMVRSLLEERFKITGHSGTRDGQVNALTVARPGVGLKQHAEGAPCEVTPPVTTWAYPPYKDFPVHCGVFDRELGKYKRRIELVNVTMQQVADSVSGHSPLPVIDATGLKGHYDGFLDYGPELPPDVEAAVEVGSPASVALEKQFGLKLVKQNAPVEYFVIDHIEKPSEN